MRMLGILAAPSRGYEHKFIPFYGKILGGLQKYFASRPKFRGPARA